MRSATSPTSRLDGRPLPQLGSVAEQSGKRAAKNIVASPRARSPKPFHYHDKGIMAMIGRNAAVAEVGKHRHHLEGPVAFVAWLGLHAVLLSGMHSRVDAFLNWADDYFHHERAADLELEDSVGRIAVGRRRSRPADAVTGENGGCAPWHPVPSPPPARRGQGAPGGGEPGSAEADAGGAPWRDWGPYLSERAWGTVREDYSANGDAWDFFPHDHARSRVYRWNEDGMAGFCDATQNWCLSLALWNGVDPILKERMFGLTGPQGNHGEDVKEYWWYLDGTPPTPGTPGAC